MDTLCNKSQRPFLKLFSFLIFSFTFCFSLLAQPDGAKIFKQNCAVCHRLDNQKLTGPGLEGIASRAPSDKWLHDWIKNNEKVRKSGDTYANKIYQENGGVQMTVFENLSDDEIAAVIKYVKNPPAAPVAATNTTGAATTGEPAAEESSNSFFIILALIVFLIVLIAVLRGVKRTLTNVSNQKQGLPELPELGAWRTITTWMGGNKRKVALIIIFLMAWGSKVTWDSLMGIGVFQGYKPEQPIKFSHKIHAGDNGINCVYCHSGAEKGKTAGIPTANVCMNCHKGISKGPTTGETEIKKIYEAVGFNPETQKYDKPQHPIKWNRVHNLQDFVYFNHSQHVVVGKQDCENCHGEVKKMDLVQQHSPLTMGWCIDCHRKTEVSMDKNPYYEDLHKKLAEKYKGQKITVDKMGGIECAKCHY